MIRIPIIDKDKCKPKKCRHECKSKCPVNMTGKQCIEIEELGKIAKINESLCIGCGICVKVCPFDAIKMVNLPSQISNNLVHSYGENMFRLYKLPMPKSGKIIGILGPNGCGKTTIMNILSNQILPNFSLEDNAKITTTEVLKNVRGTELQKYLKLLYDGKLVVNTKQQDIMMLVKRIKNKDTKVQDIVNKFKDSKNYKKIIDSLELDKLFDNKVLELSGGELQKIVCAVTLLRDGNVYIFDEPTNYLDIEYRIKVANLIKDLIDKDKYVFVVEHDLSILDFVADHIHVMYGEPGAYGVVSTLYSTLEGINIYFDGYIPADNVRFRAEPYKLNDTQIVEEQLYSNVNGIVSYDDVEIKYDHFNLRINKSQISSKDNMIVILGKNGTGKTTYLNWLKNTLGFIISHKPQINTNDYSNDKITVKDLLYTKIRDAMLSNMFVSDVINLLGVNKIYNKKVKKLSGGETQRLGIVLCLGTSADIYLIDEPSASLDIEQRFNATKVIKRFLLHNKKIGFIVEHDILMAITLAKEQTSKVLVFEEVKCEDNVRYCETSSLLDFNTGINKFLKSIDTTFRTDRDNKRPKLNKLDSVIDREQKQSNIYYQ
ncbi:RNAse l inhibitor RLI1 [Fadolivirus algeromassiliense]|jgi:ATP-binding cassette subfamily E protein 1|uniref:RNAse l inhibitor RLI1 n=1 Tax=Fadolivirus FV1/VV64 TaxID=3070911 RepID=A0A7D3QW06_9VIRU|nr:RNAse l inhibitor RLI1 [Fadolivirus algeromassiliense]QKF94119.1 RNAse l inhibitor RLI1 [Fadolivirus FV1/VV64]